MRFLSLALVLLFINGCGITSPQNLGHQYKFTLASTTVEAKRNDGMTGLIVDFPRSNIDLDTYRIALLRDAGTRDYFASARWAEFLPVLVQSSVVESLQNTNYFKVVAADHTPFPVDYKLQMNINVFEACYEGTTTPIVKIKIAVNVLDLNTQEVIKSFNATKNVELETNNLSAIHKGFDKAFSSVQRQITNQTIKALRHEKAEKARLDDEDNRS